MLGFHWFLTRTENSSRATLIQPFHTTPFHPLGKNFKYLVDVTELLTAGRQEADAAFNRVSWELLHTQHAVEGEFNRQRTLMQQGRLSGVQGRPDPWTEYFVQNYTATSTIPASTAPSGLCSNLPHQWERDECSHCNVDFPFG